MKPSHRAPASNPSQVQEFTLTQVGGCTVLTVVADLDIATVGAFSTMADEAVAAGRPVVLDMSACSYSDSTGLRAIALAHATFPAGSGIVVPPKGTVRRLFAITGFDVALVPVATLAEALKSAGAVTT